MQRGVITVAAIVVVVGGVILMGRSDATPGPQTPPSVTPNADPASNQGPKPEIVLPVKIVLECESPATFSNKTDNGTVVMEIKEHSEGRPIKFIDIPEGWIKQCGMEDIKSKPEALPGKASYVFDAPRDDTYYINLRAKWFDECGDSVYVKVDDGEYYTLEDSNGKMGEKNYRWDWHQLMVGGKAKGFELKKGQHTLWLNVREDGPWLDQWVVTTEASAQVGEAVREAKTADPKN